MSSVHTQVVVPQPERSFVWLRITILLAAIVPSLIFLAVSWVSYADALNDAHARLEYVARIAEEHAARVTETNDVVMQQMLRLLGDDDEEAIHAREAELHQLAAAIVTRFPHLRALSLWDAQGGLLVSSHFFPAPRSLDAGDWAHFRAAKSTGNVAFAARMLTDRSSGERLISVARPRRLSSGEVRGMVELTLIPSRVSDFYRRILEAERDVSVVLVNSEGVIMAGWPPASLSQTRLAAGSALLLGLQSGETRGSWAEGTLTGSDGRYGAFRRVGDYPLFVAAAQETTAVFADWKRQMTVLGGITLPTTLALVISSWLVLRRTRREMQARHQLREESEQRLRTEEALRHAQKLEALGQLTGGVAHDFNNLLMVVSNNAYLLARFLPQAAARPELASIRRAVESGGKLTRQLLTFSRRQALRTEVLPPQAALAGMLDLLGTTAGKGIVIEARVDPETPPIEVDAGELEMALINLVANARDAMSHKGRLEIIARAASADEGGKDQADGYAVISVRDTGQGMSPEVMHRAYEPFFTTKPAGVGTGLGLSQVYGFCAQAGGHVEISSAPGAGTTVSMFLPASSKAAPRPETRAPAASELSARVLLVEDNRDLSVTISSALEQFGCVVTSVSSADEAENTLRATNRRFDVVLSDIVMPGTLDGVALACDLRKRQPDLPVVLMTGYSKEAGNATAAGLIVLVKPCTPEEIVSALGKAMLARQASPVLH